MTNKVLVKSTGAISGFYYVHRGPALGSKRNNLASLASVCDVLPIVPVLFTNSLNKE